MVLSMVIADQVGVRMMKEYFDIEASKATPQYGFRKGLQLFGDKVIRLPRMNSRLTYLEEDALICCHGGILLGILESKLEGISCSSREKKVER